MVTHCLTNTVCRIIVLLGLLVASGQSLATCTGTVSTSPFTPALVLINKNTPVGQVVSSATVTLNVSCTPSGTTSQGWAMNYTPQQPIQAGQMLLNSYGTSMAGLGYRMYGTNGVLIRPTTYGTNGGDNFGPGGMGPAHPAAPTSTETYQFKLDLVRTNTSLTSGTFSDSLVRFGYQKYDSGGTPNGCPEGPPNSVICTQQFGDEVTSPVTFQFVNPSCTITAGTANQAVTLPTALTSDFVAVGTTAKPTDFTISLENCVTETIASMQLDGTTVAPTVLANTGSASGVGIQVTQNGSPITFGQALNLGNVGSSQTMDVPMIARYYRTGAMSGGNVASVATISMSYQ